MEEKENKTTPESMNFCKGKYLFTIFTIILVDKHTSPRFLEKIW